MSNLDDLEREAIRALNTLAQAYTDEDHKVSTLGYTQVIGSRGIIRREAARRAAENSFEAKCRQCRFYCDQKDRNGDIAITFCSHMDNPNKAEGNTTAKLCPLNKVANGAMAPALPKVGDTVWVNVIRGISSVRWREGRVQQVGVAPDYVWQVALVDGGTCYARLHDIRVSAPPVAADRAAENQKPPADRS